MMIKDGDDQTKIAMKTTNLLLIGLAFQVTPPNFNP